MNVNFSELFCCVVRSLFISQRQHHHHATFFFRPVFMVRWWCPEKDIRFVCCVFIMLCLCVVGKHDDDTVCQCYVPIHAKTKYDEKCHHLSISMHAT